MKTRTFIGKLLLLPAALLAFVSCVDKPEIPKIAIAGYTFFIEQNPVSESVTEYIPYIGFEYNGEEALGEGVIEKDGVSMSPRSDSELQSVSIYPQAYSTTSLTEHNGTYTFNPIGTKGHDWEQSFEVEFDGDEDMGPVVVTDFRYENGTIYGTFDKTENATYFGFYVQALVGGVVNTSYATVVMEPLNMFLLVPKNVAATPTQDVSFMLKADLLQQYYGIERIRITPITANLSSEYNARLIRKADAWEMDCDDTEEVFIPARQG